MKELIERLTESSDLFEASGRYKGYRLKLGKKRMEDISNGVTLGRLRAENKLKRVDFQVLDNEIFISDKGLDVLKKEGFFGKMMAKEVGSGDKGTYDYSVDEFIKD